MLIALSGHSFLAGLALGSEPEVASALVLAVAILMHKSLDGFALGVSLVRHPMSARRAWMLLALFSVATPLGIACGGVLGASVEGRALEVSEALLLSLAAGTFVYVATIDIFREADPRSRLRKWLVAGAGVGVMILLARWV